MCACSDAQRMALGAERSAHAEATVTRYWATNSKEKPSTDSKRGRPSATGGPSKAARTCTPSIYGWC